MIMKLSKVLDSYYVISMGAIVSFTMAEDRDMSEAININFIVDGQEYDQYFNDQDIILDPSLTGSFVVTDVDEEQCQFMALNGVDLEKADGKS